MFIEFINFYQYFIYDFSKIAILFTSILKISFQLAGVVLFTNVDNSKTIANSSGKNRKSVTSNFTKAVHRVEKPCFLTLDTKQAFT